MDEFRDEVRREADALGFDMIDLPDIAAGSVEDAIYFLVGHLASTGRLGQCDVQAAATAVLYRESLGSTGVGDSLAIPQAALSGITEDFVGVVANSAKGISWKAIDDAPVRWIVLFLNKAGFKTDFLLTLERLLGALRRKGR